MLAITFQWDIITAFCTGQLYSASTIGNPTHRQPRCPAREAQKGRLPGPLSLHPPQRLQLREALSLCNQLLYAQKPAVTLVFQPGDIHEKDTLLGNTDRPRCQKRGFEERGAGDERIGARGRQLML